MLSKTIWAAVVSLLLAGATQPNPQETSDLFKNVKKLSELTKTNKWAFLVCDCWGNRTLYISAGRIEVVYPKGDVAKELGLPWNRDLDHFAEPTLSPEGDSVCHVRRRSAAKNDEAITIYNLRVAASKDLLYFSKPIRALAWSPTGKEIGFIAENSPEDRYRRSLYTVRLDNREVSDLTPDAYLDPNSQVSWSPDGKEIAVQQNYDSTQGPSQGVVVVNRLTKSIRRLDYGESPSWSPDGQRIAFVGIDGKTCYTIRPDGSEKRILFSHRDFGIFPSGDRIIGPLVWSPDMRNLIYHRTNGDGGRAYLFDLNRQERKEIHSGWRIYVVDWRFTAS
jgi:dipeptidyl aminopeptidase/acylaminoacyl peptidase